ncbi:vesicle-associated membrane protein 3 isoform X1 [Onychostruthus taczanowskii]|uniref:vesicle-associated membrane protein 3 isoform X1 n=2 Tax=Onychostruthus taczanowskii TaxID=356909 RepID=UPI001B808322|nr:vesicle-associated membrane protein 3 isoform X1 [Onychostruthus taczanowskii]
MSGTLHDLHPLSAAKTQFLQSANVPGSSNMAAGSNRRLQQTQHQVDEVVDIMRVNVDKVLERDQKLSELDDRADALQAGASQFETSAAKLKRKYWWKNCKLLPKVGIIFDVGNIDRCCCHYHHHHYCLECVFMNYQKKLNSTEGAFENLLQPLHFKPAAFSARLLLFKANLF